MRRGKPVEEPRQPLLAEGEPPQAKVAEIGWSFVSAVVAIVAIGLAAGALGTAISGIAYSPAAPADWPGSPPTKVQQALDAIAGYALEVQTPVPRPLLGKLEDWVSIKDYGALGDNVANDLPAFAAAFSSGTKQLYVPAGTYLLKFSSYPPLSAPSNMVVFGDGKGLSTLLFTPTASYTNSTLYGTALWLSGVSNFQLSSLTISLVPYSVSDRLAIVGVANSSSSVTFDGVELNGNMADNGAVMLTTSNVQGFYFPDGDSGTNDDLWMRDCEVHNVAYAIFKSNNAVSTQTTWAVTGSYFHHNYGADIMINTPNGPNCAHFLIEGNVCADNRANITGFGSQCISFAGKLSDVVIANNIVAGTYIYSAIHLEDAVTQFAIVGNVIDSVGWGITLQSNNVTGTRGWPMYGTVTGNTVNLPPGNYTGQYAGIALPSIDATAYEVGPGGFPQAQHVAIAYNVVSGPFTYGMDIGAHADDDIKLIGNSVVGAGWCYLIDGGSLSFDRNSASGCTGRGLSGTATTVGSIDFVGKLPLYVGSNGLTEAWGGVVLRTATFAFSSVSIPAGSSASFYLLTLGANDRLSGTIDLRYYGDVSSDWAVASFANVTWTGSSLTYATAWQNLHGNLYTTSVNDIGGVLVVQVWVTSAYNVTAGRSNIVLDGFYQTS